MLIFWLLLVARVNFQITWQKSKAHHNKGECAIRCVKLLAVGRARAATLLCGVGGTDLCIKARTLTAPLLVKLGCAASPEASINSFGNGKIACRCKGATTKTKLIKVLLFVNAL
jgi:hypothetical protein